MVKKHTKKKKGTKTPKKAPKKTKRKRPSKKSLTKRAKALKKKAQKKTARPKAKRQTRRKVKIAKVYSLEELLSKVKAAPPTEEHMIEETKFDIGVPHNAQAMPSYDIAQEYHVDRAVILTVDPKLIFAYWEIRPQSMHEAMAHVGSNAKLTLRFYDISSNTDPDQSPSWDVEVFDRLGNWYLRLDYPEQKLCLDVGLKNEKGVFHTIARSNIIRIPRRALARPGPLKWMVVSPDGQKVITDVEEYTEADLQLLRRILGPHFFELLMRGQFASIAGSSLEAVFQNVSSLHLPVEVSSSPSSWSRRP